VANRSLFLGVIAALAALALGARPSRGGEKFKLKKAVALGVDGRLPARLSPDGKRVLYAKRLEGGKDFAYWTIDADGKNDRQVFATSVGWDDVFTFCFGKGLFSPDGKRFVALTTSDGKSIRDEGAPAMMLCEFAGKPKTKAKPKGLPSKTGRCVGALFAADGSVIFADGFPASPKNEKEPWSFTLRKVSPKGKVSDLVKIDTSLLVAMTMNPKRDRVAGVLVTRPAGGGRGRPNMRLWVCDLASGKVTATGDLKLDDYFYGGGPGLFWSLDGRYVYANGNPGGSSANKRPFSLLRFEPFRKKAKATADETRLYQKFIPRMGADDFATREKATAQLRAAGDKALPVLREAAKSKDVEIRSRAEQLVAALSGNVEVLAAGKSLISLGEIAPGKLSVASKSAKKCYVLDTATGTKTECQEPLLLIDRSGSTGLFVHLTTRKLHVAKLKAAP
jgi:hypothetical protein